MRNLGGVVGIAMLATIIDTRSRHYLWQIKENLTAGSLNLTVYLTNAGNMLTEQGGNIDQAYRLLMKEISI
jgi:DHA2 family multidrug resistance protein